MVKKKHKAFITGKHKVSILKSATVVRISKFDLQCAGGEQGAH